MEGILAAADPALAPFTSLDAAADSPLTQARDAISNATNADVSHIDALDPALDRATEELAPVIALVPVGADDVRRAGAVFRATITRRLRETEHAVGHLRSQLSEMRAERERLEAQIAADDQERIAALGARVEAQDQAITSQETALSSAIASFEERYGTAQEERRAAWAAQSQEMADKFRESQDEVLARAQADLDQLRTASTEILEDAEHKQRRVSELYGLITDRATSGTFGKDAEAQKGEADTWGRNAVRLGLVSAVVAIGAVVFTALDEDGSTSAHIGAILVAILLSGITAYAARQSGSHRQREIASKRLELELIAFGPFTDAMGEAAGDARAEYARRLFRGGESLPARSGDHQVTLAQTLGEGVIEAARRLGNAR